MSFVAKMYSESTDTAARENLRNSFMNVGFKYVFLVSNVARTLPIINLQVRNVFYIQS